MLNKVTPPIALSAAGASASNGTVVFSNSNGVSFGQAGSTITATVATNYLTTAMASNRGSDFVQATAAFAGTNASGTINSAGISVSVNATVAQSNQTVGWYASSNTTLTSSGTVDARSLTVRAIGSLTAGFSNGELLLSAPAALTTADLSQNSSKYVQNWKLTGNTAGTTSSAQGTDLWFSGGNSLTVSGNSNTVVFSVGNYITTADLSQNSSKYVQNWKLTGNTAGTTSSAQGTDLWLSGGNSITVSGNSNTVVFSVGNYITTADLSQNSSKYVQNWKLTGNTAGTTSSAQGTDLWLSGGNSITVSGNSNTVVFSVGNYITTADLSQNSSKYVQNWKLTGNTAGTTSSAQGTDLWFGGGNNITVSGSSNSISFSVFNQTVESQTHGASNLGSTFGTSGVASGGQVQAIICATDGLGISQSVNGASVTDTVVPWYLSNFANLQPGQANASNVTIGQNSLYFMPIDVPAPLSAYRVNFFLSVATTVSNANSTGSGGYTFSAALYSRQTGTGTERISSFWSCSAAMGLTCNSNTQLAITNIVGISNSTKVSTVQSSISNANATTYAANSMGGYRMLALPISSTITPGRYWLAVANSSGSTNAGVCVINCSVVQVQPAISQIAWQPFGGSSSASNASMFGPYEGFGTYASTSGAFPGTVPLTSDSIRQQIGTPTIVLAHFSAFTTGAGYL